MHPPMSLILFFLTAGLSIGSFTGIFLIDLIKGLSSNVILITKLIATALIGLGAFSASFHLGHKMRAWKAIKRFNTSWLSREAVFSGIFGFLLFVSFLIQLFYNTKAYIILDILAVITGWLSAFSTAMIYTSNRFVPDWNTSLNTLYFLNMYGFLGTSLASLILYLNGNVESTKIMLIIALSLFIVGLAIRVAYNVRRYIIKLPTLNDALNLPQNREVKVLDKGSTTDNYCTTEFYYKKGKKLLPSLLPPAYILTFAVPIMLLITCIAKETNTSFLALSLMSATVGSFIERWCFFVEGRHVQNLYYGLL